MYALIVYLTKFLVLFGIWAVFLAGLVLYTKTAIGRFWSHSVQIGTFADINDGSKDLSDVMISRADELGRPVSLDALFEVRVPSIKNNFATKDDLKFLEDTKLTFQGVDVPGLVRAFINVLPDNRYIVTAKASNLGAAGPVLSLEFRQPFGTGKSWLLRTEHPVSGAAAAGETTSQVIDRAIYTIWYYLYYDHNGLRWRKDLEANFTSARAVEAYYGGQQRMASYQRAFQASDLDEAAKEFRLLTSEMPQFVPGWMWLGMALMEERSERDAIRAFDRAQQLLAPGGTLRADATASDRKIWLQARLFTADARLKLYDWKDNHQALHILERILLDIPNQQPHGVSRQDFYDLRKIRFSVLFQVAHTVGHELILLQENNFVDALTAAPGRLEAVPALISPTVERQAALRDHENAIRSDSTSDELRAAKMQRATDFAEEITRLFRKQQELVANAEDFLRGIDALVNDTTVSDPERLSKEEWERERAKLVADLRNADGYARFRYAQLHETDDGSFRVQCEAALGKLIDAQAARSNEYTVLQNMGLIYGDPRYDPEGKELDTARALFSRSLEIKSRDYYGYQELATLAIRQAYEWGPEFMSLDAIEAAIAQAEKARELRPADGTIFALMAQIYTLKWTKATGAVQQDVAALIDAALAQAARGDPASSVHLSTANLQWQLARLRTAANKEEYENAKVKLLANLHAVEESVASGPGWNARNLLAHVKSLRAKLKDLKFEDRAALRWHT